MRVAMFSSKPYDRRSFEQRNGDFGHELHFLEPRLGAETVALARGYPAVVSLRQRHLRCPDAGTAGRRRHAAGSAALRRVQQCRPRRRGQARAASRPGPGLLATRRCRVHGRHDPDAQPSDPSRLQPHARKQFRVGRPARFRPARQDGGRRRYRQDRCTGGAHAEPGLRLPGPRPRRGARSRARRHGVHYLPVAELRRKPISSPFTARSRRRPGTW